MLHRQKLWLFMLHIFTMQIGVQQLELHSVGYQWLYLVAV